MIVALVFSLLFLFSTIFMTYKYIKLKNWTKSYQEIGTGRYGFYMYSTGSYSAIVYVHEIDRFTDGYSKIKFHYAEPNGSWQKESAENARNKFISLRATKEVEWLESEENIRKIRKEKLENLKKL